MNQWLQQLGTYYYMIRERVEKDPKRECWKEGGFKRGPKTSRRLAWLAINPRSFFLSLLIFYLYLFISLLLVQLFWGVFSLFTSLAIIDWA